MYFIFHHENYDVENGPGKLRKTDTNATQGSLKLGLICLCQHFKTEGTKGFVFFVLMKNPDACKDLYATSIFRECAKRSCIVFPTTRQKHIVLLQSWYFHYVSLCISVSWRTESMANEREVKTVTYDFSWNITSLFSIY